MAVAPTPTKKQFWRYIPLLGIPSFILLYIIATFYYPGGSQADNNAIGFSWLHNYWCNLLNTTAINGQANPAKPIAISAMVLLCISLSAFWYAFPAHMRAKRSIQQTVRLSGVLTMAAASLLGVLEHDLALNIASLLGVAAVLGTLIILKKQNWPILFWYGMINVLLVGVNNLFYYQAGLLQYLPIVQKLTFASFLLWLWLITYYARPRNQSLVNNSKV
jgi:hypothetical protein